MSNKYEQYDVTPQEYRNIKDRARIRAEMRSQFLKLYENPHKMCFTDQGYAFDPVLQRYLAFRSQQWPYFKPNPRTLIYPLGLLASIYTVARIMKWDRDKREYKYRTGQVGPRDRKFRFN